MFKFKGYSSSQFKEISEQEVKRQLVEDYDRPTANAAIHLMKSNPGLQIGGKLGTYRWSE